MVVVGDDACLCVQHWGIHMSVDALCGEQLFSSRFTFAAISGLYQFLMLSANSVLPSLTAQESLPWSVLYPHGIIPFVEVGIGYTIISASPDLNF